MRTPFYYYNLDLLDRTLREARRAAGSIHVHYAVKANSNRKILERIAAFGFGADCVSGNEIRRALECGFPAAKIVFAGVGKTDDELELAIRNEIECIHVESLEELLWIDQISGDLGKNPRIAIRVNPDLNAATHEHITTGRIDNKFGFPFHELEKVPVVIRQCKNLEFVGLHFHVGSQITDMQVFKNLAHVAMQFVMRFRELGLTCSYLNLGGGLGVNYNNPDADPVPDFERWLGNYQNIFTQMPGLELHCEPGRALVAQCGTLVSKVLFTKSNGLKNFAIIDAGMNDLVRPALYGARHAIETSSAKETVRNYDVVGPVCESSDIFAKGVLLPELHRGDFILIRSAGAYGETMASSYNLREMVGAVFSDEFSLDQLLAPANKMIV